MKKFIYIALFAVVTSLTISSCTEEEITPAAETNNQGGTHLNDPLK